MVRSPAVAAGPNRNLGARPSPQSSKNKATHAQHAAAISQNRWGNTVGGRTSGGATVLATVLNVTVAFAAFMPSSGTDDGETVHVEAAGAPEQLHVTMPTNPEAGVAVTVKVVFCPAVRVPLLGDEETL